MKLVRTTLLTAHTPFNKNSYLDPIPILPGRLLGFAHPHGEVHILSPGNAVSCPGKRGKLWILLNVKIIFRR